MLWIGLWWYETCLNRIEIMPVWLETQLDRVEIESDYMDRIGERESLVGRARECIWGTEGAPGAWVHIDTHKNSQRSRGDKGRTMFVMLWKQNGNKDLFWWIKRNLGDFSGQDIYIYSTFFLELQQGTTHVGRCYHLRVKFKVYKGVCQLALIP